MRTSLETLLGVLDGDAPRVAAEDWDGALGELVGAWQKMGFVGGQAERHPSPSCPACREGVPHRAAGRYLCNVCHSPVDEHHLLLWPLDREAFLNWVARSWRLRGGVRRLDERLWQLGTWTTSDSTWECFFRRSGAVSEPALSRLRAYRQALIVHAVPMERSPDPNSLPHLYLAELLRTGATTTLHSPAAILRSRGNIRFDSASGALWAGSIWLGDVPLRTREFFLMEALAKQLDRFVAYADLKDYVLCQSGGADQTEEATFCQGLKSRIKRKCVPRIDELMRASNRAEGYRLLARLEA